jgi:hypothetical protein
VIGRVVIQGELRRVSDGWEANLIAATHRRWVRLFACYGPPPGSHIGLWHTQMGQVHGWNLRIGRRYVGPCLTLLAHTRSGRESDRCASS